ncbi:MAG: glycosyltransferase family 4 protein [Oscillospiraceae bacterium]|nr:glycosyltransferase family 4 protein [Oscillospiraceae bacterium]
MNIAFLVLDIGASGGAERAVSALSGRMAGLGHGVTVFSLIGSGSFYTYDERVNVVYLQLPELPKGGSFGWAAAAVKRAVSIRRAVREADPDILVGMSHIMTFYAVFAATFTRVKIVGAERNNPYMLSATKFMSAMRRLASLLCGGYVFQTEKARAFFPRSVQQRGAVIPNAVFNPLAFEAERPKSPRKTVTALGRLVPAKGFDVLIRAFADVSRTYPEHRLIIFGDGGEREKLTALANELGAGERVVFPGTSPDAVREVARSSVFVLSSRYEGMPNALIEAMACGVPCVSTLCQMGPEELITDGVNGILIPVDDTDAMSAAMIRVLSDPELSARLSDEAIKIRKTHSLESVTDQWLNYFEGIL